MKVIVIMVTVTVIEVPYLLTEEGYVTVPN